MKIDVIDILLVIGLICSTIMSFGNSQYWYVPMIYPVVIAVILAILGAKE